MFKKCLSVVLAAMVAISVAPTTAFAKSKVEKEVAKAEKVKAGIISLGLGPDARVRLKLKDKTRVEGYVSKAANDLVVMDAKTGAEITVDYAQVSSAQGHNLSTGAKIAIGVGIAATIAIVVLVIAFHGFTAA
jgi:hypothetical protein